MKHLKRCAALVLSLAMAIQFGLGNNFTIYADDDTAQTTEQSNLPLEEETEVSEGTEQSEVPKEEGTTPQTPPAENQETKVPEQPQVETADVLVVEFVDENGTQIKSMDPISLSGKEVGKTFTLDEYKIDVEVEGYVLEKVEDVNVPTQNYPVETIKTQSFTYTQKETKLRLTYKKESKPQTDSNNNQQDNTADQTEEGEDSEDSDESDSEEEKEKPNKAPAADKNELLANATRVSGTVEYEVGEKVNSLSVTCENDGWLHSHSWSSDNRDIATVTTKGNWGQNNTQTVTVKTNRTGTAHIKCDGKTILTVVVKEPEVPATILELNKDTVTLQVDKSETVRATTEPENATVNWKSNNTNVATVDSNGKITATGIGTTTIVASSGDLRKTVSVEVTRNTDKDEVQTAYFYVVYPGVTNPSGGSGGATFNPGDWLFAGEGEVSLPKASDTSANTIITGNLGITTPPTYYINKTITVNGVKYSFDSEGTGAYGTFSVVWDKAIRSDGANNSNKWDSENGINVGLTNDKCWHIDGHLVLHSEDKVNINFLVKNPGQGGFTSVQGNAQEDQFPQMVDRGTSLSEIHQPSQNAVPQTKVVGGVTYTFDGWYTDETCTTKQDFSTGTLENDANWYGRYVAELVLSVNNINKTYDGISTALEISGNIPQGYKKQYKNDNGDWEDISGATYKNVVEKEVDVRVLDDSDEVVWEDTATVNIDPIIITLESEGGSKPYDGTPLTKPEVTIQGEFAPSEGFKTDPTAAPENDVIDAGDEEVNKISYELQDNTLPGNYTFVLNEGTLFITQASSDALGLRFTDEIVTYNGDNHSVDPAVVTVTQGTTIKYALSEDAAEDEWVTDLTQLKGAVQKDAGEYPYIYVKAENPNYETAIGKARLVINKRDLTLTSANLEKEYDGDPLVNGETPLAAERYIHRKPDSGRILCQLVHNPLERGNGCGQLQSDEDRRAVDSKQP